MFRYFFLFLSRGKTPLVHSWKKYNYLRTGRSSGFSLNDSVEQHSQTSRQTILQSGCSTVQCPNSKVFFLLFNTWDVKMRLGGGAKMMPWKIFQYKLLKVARDCIIHVAVYSYEVQDRSLHCCSHYAFQLVASVACGECHTVAKNRYILHPHTQEVTLSPQTDFAPTHTKGD